VHRYALVQTLTAVDLLISLKIFLGRFDMRVMQGTCTHMCCLREESLVATGMFIRDAASSRGLYRPVLLPAAPSNSCAAYRAAVLVSTRPRQIEATSSVRQGDLVPQRQQ